MIINRRSVGILGTLVNMTIPVAVILKKLNIVEVVIVRLALTVLVDEGDRCYH